MRTVLIITAVLTLTVAGDFALKQASGKVSPFVSAWFISGAIFYAATTVGWIVLMQTHGLAQIGVIYSSATIVALTLLGIFCFGETLTGKQVAGLTAALASVVLIES